MTRLPPGDSIGPGRAEQRRFAWGRNDVGQLGDGTGLQRTTPVPVSDLNSGVTAVAAGGNFGMALRSGLRLHLGL